MNTQLRPALTLFLLLSLVTGLAIDRVGAPVAIAVNGLLLSLVALWFLVRRDVPRHD